MGKLVIMSYFFMLLKYLSSGKHLLMSLLSLEGMGIIVLFQLMLMMSEQSLNLESSLSYMVMMVGEGTLGLSLLVIVSRSIGKDKFYFMNLM